MQLESSWLRQATANFAINAGSKADAVTQRPEPRVIQPMSRRQCTNSRKSLDLAISAAAFRAQVEPSCTLNSKAKRLGVF